MSFPADKITETREYLTHHNGGRPFKVIINEDYVSVYKRHQLSRYKIKKYIKSATLDNVWANVPYDIPIVKPTRYIKVFIGKDDNYRDNGDGNSIFIQLSKMKWLYVGGLEIYTFHVSEEITGFYSRIGNNDITYPYAVGKKNTYLLAEKIYIPNNAIDENEDVYNHFYGYFIVNQDKQLEHQQRYKQLYQLLNFKLIEKRDWGNC
jgi:hypothetical protein